MDERPDLRMVPAVDAADSGEIPLTSGEILVFVESGSVVVLLRGDIDLTTAAELEEAGRAAIDERLPIMIDVRHVDMIDSVGLSFLVRLAASVRGSEKAGGRESGTLTLCGPAPMVDELLGIAGARGLFSWIEGRPGPDGRPTL